MPATIARACLITWRLASYDRLASRMSAISTSMFTLGSLTMPCASAAGLAGSTFYVQIQLDGTVRASGVGAPPWASLARDLPALDSLQTTLTDGVAR